MLHLIDSNTDQNLFSCEGYRAISDWPCYICRMEDEEDKYFQFFGLTFPIYKKMLIKYTLIVWICMLLVLAISIYFFSYEMTDADLPCGTLAGFLFAYLLTILVK